MLFISRTFTFTLLVFILLLCWLLISTSISKGVGYIFYLLSLVGSFYLKFFCCLCLLLLSLFFVLSSILFMNLYINVLYLLIFYLMPDVKDQKSHSLHLISANFFFVTIIFRRIDFNFYNFLFYLRSSE